MLLSSSCRYCRTLLQFCMRAKNLGSGIPLKSIQSSNFLPEKTVCMLLDSKNFVRMKKLKGKLQLLKQIYQWCMSRLRLHKLIFDQVTQTMNWLRILILISDSEKKWDVKIFCLIFLGRGDIKYILFVKVVF